MKPSLTRTPMRREPVCPVKFCPTRLRDFRGDKADWHRCWCGSLEIEHHHVESRGMGGTKTKSHIVALCHKHHEAVTLHECYDLVTDLEGTKTYTYMDARGNTIHTRTLEAGSAAAEADERGSSQEPLTVASSAAAPPASGESHPVGHVGAGATVPSINPPAHEKPTPLGASGARARGLRASSGKSSAAEASEAPCRVASVSPFSQTSPRPSAAPPSLTVFTEDWASLSDDELQLKYDTADQMQGMAFLLKCKAVHAYRENHIQAWGESWTDQAIERFNISRRYCYAFANLWEISVSRDTNMDHIIPLTESRSLMQAIGRRPLEDGKAAMEVAVAHHAEYAEPPTVAALEHALGTEEKPRVKRWTREAILAFKADHENRETAHCWYATCPYCSVVDVLLDWLETSSGG